MSPCAQLPMQVVSVSQSVPVSQARFSAQQFDTRHVSHVMSPVMKLPHIPPDAVVVVGIDVAVDALDFDAVDVVEVGEPLNVVVVSIVVPPPTPDVVTFFELHAAAKPIEKTTPANAQVFM